MQVEFKDDMPTKTQAKFLNFKDDHYLTFSLYHGNLSSSDRLAIFADIVDERVTKVEFASQHQDADYLLRRLPDTGTHFRVCFSAHVLSTTLHFSVIDNIAQICNLQC